MGIEDVTMLEEKTLELGLRRLVPVDAGFTSSHCVLICNYFTALAI
jgi:hypothetical protein